MTIAFPASTAGGDHRRAEAERGFTLAEMLVTLFLVSLVLIGVLTLFDLASRTARTQTHLAEMQQSLRVAQQTLVKVVRMAGRGGLPTWDPANATNRLPTGVAVAVANNVAASTLIAGNAGAPVLAGTDVVTVRGVFDTPIYQRNPAGGGFNFVPGSGAETGSVTLASTTPSGAPQSLDAIRDAVQKVQGAASGGGSHPEALLLVSPLGEWAVVEIIPGSTLTTNGTEVTDAIVAFQVTGGDFSAEYGGLSRGGSYPPTLETVAYVGLLEEYQFYVREVRAVPGDASSDLMPELVRARLYPNTGVAWDRSAASLTEVIADNVLDLQVAFGIDLDNDELLVENHLSAGGDPTKDEWLFNAVGDDPDPLLWNVANGSLYYLRLNTVVRTDRATAYFDDEPLGVIEDKDYSVAPFNAYNAEWQRRYHRRLLSTTVDLRNL
ncbi:MAG TPA: PilW family protein [Thermoanaerobaculia bacterium]|nr:PilW family protein [Thermoanaerobaculia bacterium]